MKIMTSPGTDWQLSCMDLKQRGLHLLQTGQWADCTFLVGQEQATIKAHKLILASASPVFEAMFYGAMAEKDGPIEISDVLPDAFQTLLQYIYTDKAKISSFERACSVYYSAKKYMLPYLEKDCAWFISLNLNPQNVCRAYELAALFDEKLLMDKCLKVMATRTKEVINDESFGEVDIDTLITLLSQDHLNIESELDLFYAIEKYANIFVKEKRSLDTSIVQESPAKRLRKRSAEMGALNSSVYAANLSKVFSNTNTSLVETKTCSVDVNKEIYQQAGLANSAKDSTLTSLCDSNNNDADMSYSLDRTCSSLDRSALSGAIEKIRFLTLTAQQFAAGPARSPLLTESEAFAVLMNILSSQAPVPMPQGFSTNKINRNQLTTSQEAAHSRSELVFRFTVLNFKTRRRSVESRGFIFHEMAWIVRLVPRVETNTGGMENKYFGLYLKCGGKADCPAWSAKVLAKVRLLSHEAGRAPVAADIRRTFNSKESEWGFERFVTWEEVMSSERGLLKGNAITIEVHLIGDSP